MDAFARVYKATVCVWSTIEGEAGVMMTYRTMARPDFLQVNEIPKLRNVRAHPPLPREKNTSHSLRFSIPAPRERRERPLLPAPPAPSAPPAPLASLEGRSARAREAGRPLFFLPTLRDLRTNYIRPVELARRAGGAPRAEPIKDAQRRV